MRIIRSSNLPAVVLVKGRGVRALAIPENLSASEVLELASLVLSTSEYEELRRAVQPSVQPAAHLSVQSSASGHVTIPPPTLSTSRAASRPA